VTPPTTARGRTSESAQESPLWDALQTAVLGVLADWDRAPAQETSVDHASRKLTLLADAVRGAASGDRDPVQLLPVTPLSRLLLARLRRSFIARVALLTPAPDGASLAHVCAAFEQVDSALEPTNIQRIADRLSGPDGLELLVEVAHDLRSPLTAILFLGETLLRGRSGPVNQVQERQLGLIYSAAFGLSSVASDVLELVRGSERVIDLEPQPFSLRDLYDSTRNIVLPMAEEKGLVLEMQLPAHDLRFGHPVALSRVLLNLTTNAIKFTNQGTVTVGDTGRGIPPAAMATLFEPFRRRPDQQHKYAFSGAGLGLSICRKFVTAMDGSLEVETAPNQGTRFSFVLDLPPADPGMTP
jgi:signal transduction histidine kinase